eukprot:8188308-Pyramimonas_sp.AAC.1
MNPAGRRPEGPGAGARMTPSGFTRKRMMVPVGSSTSRAIAPSRYSATALAAVALAAFPLKIIRCAPSGHCTLARTMKCCPSGMGGGVGGSGNSGTGGASNRTLGGPAGAGTGSPGLVGTSGAETAG